MVRNSNLAPKHHEVADDCTAADPALGDNDTMATNRNVMAYLNKIIDFRSLANCRISYSAPVNRRRADLP